MTKKVVAIFVMTRGSKMNLRELRFRQKLSQWDVALLSGISQTKICLMERGYITPQKNELEKLSSIFNVNPIEIEPTKPHVLKEGQQ